MLQNFALKVEIHGFYFFVVADLCYTQLSKFLMNLRDGFEEVATVLK